MYTTSFLEKGEWYIDLVLKQKKKKKHCLSSKKKKGRGRGPLDYKAVLSKNRPAATFLHNWVHFCSFFAFWASLDLCNALCSKLVSFVWERGGGFGERTG